MTDDLKQRQQDMEAEALRVNAGRKPKFGDLMRNPWASESNPQRDGYFVRSKRTTGQFNPGLWYEMTDRNGKFWEANGKFVMFIDDRATPQAPTPAAPEGQAEAEEWMRKAIAETRTAASLFDAGEYRGGMETACDEIETRMARDAAPADHECTCFGGLARCTQPLPCKRATPHPQEQPK